MAEQMAYNIALKQDDKIYAGYTDINLDISRKFKEVLTKKDKGMTRNSDDGYEWSLSVDGICTIPDNGDEATELGKEEIIALVLAGGDVDICYGDMQVGKKVLTGTVKIEKYSEKSGSDGHATYSLSLKGEGALTEEIYSED